jgi:hypothetical protein
LNGGQGGAHELGDVVCLRSVAIGVGRYRVGKATALIQSPPKMLGSLSAELKNRLIGHNQLPIRVLG